MRNQNFYPECDQSAESVGDQDIWRVVEGVGGVEFQEETISLEYDDYH